MTSFTGFLKDRVSRRARHPVTTRWKWVPPASSPTCLSFFVLVLSFSLKLLVLGICPPASCHASHSYVCLSVWIQRHCVFTELDNVLLVASPVEDQWTEYITLCGLRTHSQLSDTLVTELIYVHSKAIIADDRCYLIGESSWLICVHQTETDWNIFMCFNEDTL